MSELEASLSFALDLADVSPTFDIRNYWILLCSLTEVNIQGAAVRGSSHQSPQQFVPTAQNAVSFCQTSASHC